MRCDQKSIYFVFFQKMGHAVFCRITKYINDSRIDVVVFFARKLLATALIAICHRGCSVGCQILLLGVTVSWRSRCGNRMLVKNRKLLEFTAHAIQIKAYDWPLCSSGRFLAWPEVPAAGVLVCSEDGGCWVPKKPLWGL